jgi:multicomponent Na+:H+ antiporter subunit F
MTFATGLMIVFAMLVIALFFAFARLVRGPSLPDRVVALDLLSLVAVGITTTHAVAADQPVYLDVVIVIALLSFLGTVAFARYVEKRGHP